MSGTGFIHVHSQTSLPAIDVVQNVYDDLGLTQTVERDGSEWVRTVTDSDILQQSFSEFYGESVTSTLTLAGAAESDVDRVVSASNTISFTQGNTVAGGRISGGGGGSGDTTNTFDVTYDSAGASAVAGQIIYIDEADGEAKLAAYNGVAEVAGFLTEDVVAADATTIQTEGEIERSDWTDVVGTTNLTPGATYYLHTSGEMRVDPPVSGSIVIVGRAITSTRFDVEINLPWE